MSKITPDAIRAEVVKVLSDEETLANTFSDLIRLQFVAALQDEQVLKAVKAAVKDEVLHDQLGAITQHLKKVEDENVLLRAKVGVLEEKVAKLESAVDQVEQQERKDAVRIFGVPEDKRMLNGEQDDRKVAYELITQTMNVPQFVDRDLEVVHRVGRLPNAGQIAAAAMAGTPLKPRPILIKFVDRHVKSRVMAARKQLKDSGFFMSDDLTKTKAHLAFLSRLAKRHQLIADTWVHNSKVWRKDNDGVIKEVQTQRDLPAIPATLLPQPKRGAAAGPAAGLHAVG